MGSDLCNDFFYCHKIFINWIIANLKKLFKRQLDIVYEKSLRYNSLSHVKDSRSYAVVCFLEVQFVDYFSISSFLWHQNRSESVFNFRDLCGLWNSWDVSVSFLLSEEPVLLKVETLHASSWYLARIKTNMKQNKNKTGTSGKDLTWRQPDFVRSKSGVARSSVAKRRWRKRHSWWWENLRSKNKKEELFPTK